MQSVTLRDYAEKIKKCADSNFLYSNNGEVVWSDVNRVTHTRVKVIRYLNAESSSKFAENLHSLTKLVAQLLFELIKVWQFCWEPQNRRNPLIE